MNFETICTQSMSHDKEHRSHLTPIYASSTYTFDSAEQAESIFQGKEKGQVYGRFGSPTIEEVEQKLATLEGFRVAEAQGAKLTLKAWLHASGMAAITTMILANLKSGDKILTHHSLYGGTQELFDKVLPDLNIGLVVASGHDHEAIARTIQNDANIKMLYIETPANPTLQCFDLEKLCGIGKNFNLKICCDNTFATPYLQQPFSYGADFIIHSTTKYLNGHGTAIGGVLIGRCTEDLLKKITKFQRLLGGNSNSFDAFLLNNGLRTLPLRMDRHIENAQHVAAYLEKHQQVAQVNYLGLKSHPQFELCKKQMKAPGAMLSFELKGGIEAVRRFLNQVKLCQHAVSLGTCDTLVSHPASTTHAGVSKEMREISGITDGLVRMSVGLESIEDILADLENALQ